MKVWTELGSRNVWENKSQMIILWWVDYMFVAVLYLIIISQVVLTIVKMDLLPISILPISIKIEEKLNNQRAELCVAVYHMLQVQAYYHNL